MNKIAEKELRKGTIIVSCVHKIKKWNPIKIERIAVNCILDRLLFFQRVMTHVQTFVPAYLSTLQGVAGLLVSSLFAGALIPKVAFLRFSIILAKESEMAFEWLSRNARCMAWI